MIPGWLDLSAKVSIGLGVALALVIALLELRRAERMKIMKIVWPVTALYGTVLALWFYRRRRRSVGTAREKLFPAAVAEATLHCGSGCVLGDIAAEWLAFSVPAVAVWFGWRSLFDEKIFAVWLLDYVFAFTIGISFQYFTIAPMRPDLSFGQVLRRALKADALSLTAWQLGMFGFMAFAHFVVFERWFGVRAEADSFAFWLAMQIAMIAGFLTSFPMNWLLLRLGIKERM
jgi:hypothetical protein